jgi:ubiquinone/menaquinone biosynthesis C-methylase UbiE
MENRTSFGLDADAYRTYRPIYPDSLYQWLAGQCRRHDAALDCATGNGQAALALAEHFARVVATDTDAAQIASAAAHERIDYVVVAAEELPSDLGTFDLVAVAQGAHWFDLEVFYQRLQPLLAPGAVIAIWGYSHCRIDAQLDALLDRCLVKAVDPFWAQGNRVIMDHYRSIPFPWDEIETPEFTMQERWTRDAFFGYVKTWSAYKRLIDAGLPDPLIELAQQLDAEGLWPKSATQQVAFDIHLRVGRGSG